MSRFSTLFFFLFISYITCDSLYITKFDKCILNDNFCDCGNDEPSTSACSMFSVKNFTCVDKQWVTQSIPKSRLSDGICDCCDGSDESSGVCVYRCKEIAAKEQAEYEVREKIRQEGLLKKEAMMKKSLAYLDIIRERGGKSVKVIPETEKQIAQLRLDLIEEERLEKLELDELVQQARQQYENEFYSANSDGIQLNRMNIIAVIAAMTMLSGEESVEALLNECKGLYETPGDEPDETNALYFSMQHMISTKTVITPSIEVSADGSSDPSVPPMVVHRHVQSMMTALALDRLSDSSLKTLFPAVVSRAVGKGVLTRSYELAGVSEDLIPFDIPEDPSVVRSRGHVRQAKLDLIQRIHDMEEHLEKMKLSSSDAKKILQNDFGPDMFLFPLWNTCHKRSDEKYKYSICPFGLAKQANVILGRYQGYQYAEHSPITLKFANGDRCLTLPGRPPRTLSLVLECSSSDQLLGEVSEPEMCSYSSVLHTPIACF